MKKNQELSPRDTHKTDPNSNAFDGKWCFKATFQQWVLFLKHTITVINLWDVTYSVAYERTGQGDCSHISTMGWGVLSFTLAFLRCQLPSA